MLEILLIGHISLYLQALIFVLKIDENVFGGDLKDISKLSELVLGGANFQDLSVSRSDFDRNIIELDSDSYNNLRIQ